ncbi:MAG: type I-C CRISPR-associated protein Cas8c/Csd1 [Spirochaeta sp.]|jgi:CRISPR-associated protein Csd1|nr:type I-C CRISPR-associated protein Cas8c/Csd1 [Spirochaeta sp.]
MILQRLYDYYERMRTDSTSGIPQPGYAPQQISFAVILEKDGTLVQIQDLRDTSQKSPQPVSLIVPEAVNRSANVLPNFIWDNTGYVLGADGKGKPERTAETFAAFRELQHQLGDQLDDPGMQAVLRFLDSWNPESFYEIDGWEDVLDKNVVFRLADEHRYVHEASTVADAWISHWKARLEDDDAPVATCLVTGKETRPARLHNKIKRVPGAQSSGASIVSFNLDAFRSYGKVQNFNAPVSTEAAFAYTTALNYLLRRDSRQKIQVADAMTVFWAEQPTQVESFLGYALDPRDANLGDATTALVHAYLRALRKGTKPEEIDESVSFYILGLAPNASRIAVRFWHAGTVANLDAALGQHFQDLAIVREFDNQMEFPGIWQLLIETAPQHKSENIKPTLAGAFMRAVLTGQSYPAYLLSAIVDRIRADHTVGYYRAALIKAFLVRQARIYSKPLEVSQVLNESSTNVAYRLGRLFAVLEKNQRDAISTANATIKDRYYSSASATPGVVFAQLLRLNQHHTAKLSEGQKIHNERLMQEILDGIDGFPTHLKLEDQGLFALGYYHQRKALFTKKSDESDTE